LAGGQAYFSELLKYILRLLAFFVGNIPAMFYLALVAGNNGTPNQTKPPRYDNEIGIAKRNRNTDS
jgi:hypothetical protein